MIEEEKMKDLPWSWEKDMSTEIEKGVKDTKNVVPFELKGINQIKLIIKSFNGYLTNSYLIMGLHYIEFRNFPNTELIEASLNLLMNLENLTE